MADDQDPFASIIHHCRYTSSQEHLLAHSKFAGEDDTFAEDGVGKSKATEGSGGSRMELNASDYGGERDSVCADCEAKHDLGFPGERKRSDFEVVYDAGGKSTAEEGSGGSRKEMNGSDDGGEKDSGEFFAVCVDCEAKQDLGFPRERKRSDFEVRVSELPEPSAKKSRVSGPKSPNLKDGRVSPLMQCTEKMGIESEDNITKVTVLRNGVKVEIVSPLRYMAPEMNQCYEKSSSEGGNENQVEMRTENSANKKLEFGAEDIEEIRSEEEEGNVSEDTQNQGDGTSRDINKHGKRSLPRSLLGQVWGSANADGCEGDGNRVSGSGTSKGGLNASTVEVSGTGKSRIDETMKHIFDVLRILTFEKRRDDDGEIDIFEMAKKRGMKFPRSRFLFGTEDSE